MGNFWNFLRSDPFFLLVALNIIGASILIASVFYLVRLERSDCAGQHCNTGYPRIIEGECLCVEFSHSRIGFSH